MLKLKDLKEGDYILAEYEGRQERVMVKDFNREDGEVGVETAVQEFWFKPERLSGIALNEEELAQLGFQRQVLEDGKIKYLKGPFRMLLETKDQFSPMQIWYREDHRLISNPLFVHELQHHYSQMTKVDLIKEEA